ncbi:ribosomal-protein-alanine N-acetyltransferase [Pedobacter cryoconitis]|uniref:Ribosomal-protein-alanine N-acetyltransferase n=1 Tax=Pedobacter cryoconitis TaxID=188932 RepID=A0A7W8ZJ18_9SPHI|nr:GNAT family N-acetyltransferase [Pedobacter cryoconitis]MBB5634863.1 ribosomal-protein-alanine N-acetyltransferase [Pedobacter cryoconitis]
MLEINFDPFPILESDRLVLRRMTPADADEVFAMRSDPEIMKYIPRPLAKTRQDALDLIKVFDKGVEENNFINWGISFKDDPKLLGTICLIRMQPENFRSETGYLLHPDYHGQGIINEALGTVIDYAFNVLKFHSLEAVIDPDNHASEKVLIKRKFVKEGHFKENGFFEGRFLDSVVYSLINR